MIKNQDAIHSEDLKGHKKHVILKLMVSYMHTHPPVPHGPLLKLLGACAAPRMFMRRLNNVDHMDFFKG